MKISQIKPIHALWFCLLSYGLVVGNTYLNDRLPGGVDAAAHLFQTWFIKEHGLALWNPYWYAGSPLLDQYPPLTHVFSAVLAGFLGVVNGYKLAYALGFFMLPISFYLLLREFALTDREKICSLLIFSFSVVYIHYFQENVYSALVSFFLVILFFKYLKKTIDSGGYKNTLASALLLSLSALSHALNPVYAVLISIPMVLVYSPRRIKELAAILFVTLLLCAWFWIPFFTNYSSPKSPPQEFSLTSIPSEFGRTFVVSANYVGIFFLVVLAFLLAYITYRNIKGKRDTKYTLFTAAFFLIVFVVRFIPVMALQDPRRALFFAPLFLSIYLAKGLFGLKNPYILSALLIAPLIVLFFAYPPVSVAINNNISDVMSQIDDPSVERVLFVPDRFDLLSENRSDFPAAEDQYSTFIVPYTTGKEVLNGLWSVGGLTVNKSRDYWGMISLGCQRQKSYSELLEDASWVNKNTLGIRRECRPQVATAAFCDNAKAASLDILVVNKLFPEVLSYVQGLDCIEKKSENDNYIVYRIKDKKPYIYSETNATLYPYSKNLGRISVNFSLKEADKTTIHIAESYVNHWRASYDGRMVPVERDEDGFIKFDLDSAPGDHSLILDYLPERFGNLLSYLSAACFIIVILGLTLPRGKGISRKRSDAINWAGPLNKR